jgi:hypothetical protein
MEARNGRQPGSGYRRRHTATGAAFLESGPQIFKVAQDASAPGPACYIASMADTPAIGTVMPSATPTEEEIAAWEELPRDEQLRRTREVLTSPNASTPCNTTMEEIWAEITVANG